MRAVVIGSKNKSKLQEIREIFAGLERQFLDLGSFPATVEVVEDGQSFEENARKKAAGYAAQTGHWVLAEDSGLVVPALGGRPGIHSARYAGRQGEDDANNQKLLQEMSGFQGEQRSAFYVCSAALSDDKGNIQVEARGECHGLILGEFRGQGGFGYDPLFLIREYHATFGELSSAVKHAISHRSRALEGMRRSWRRSLAND
ncbi:MAG: RdgB/HAM1 family non-canonical purine NTP pyrophosphatase [Gemmataceae bacterium]|nr:RdgB/HAM1 family non-canonical purine NTP pyrophosphatase [Gemmataceae bacterium]